MAGSANLKLDFYESGVGDTIIVTFPGGGVGVIDAHPSTSNSRPDILTLLAGRKVHFVCLTHPHADHGRDLVPVLEHHSDVEEFWHTNSHILAFIYRLREVTSWPSEVREFALKMGGDYANFLIDLYGAIAQRGTPIHDVRAGDEPRTYDGVVVHALAPEESILHSFLQYWLEKAGNTEAEPPDLNSLSAIFALQWGNSVVLLGADALRVNWRSAVPRYRKLKLPKAIVLKAPHHGAANTMDLKAHSAEPGFLDVCLHGDMRCHSILFAGDSRHPHPKVYERLIARTEVHCLINGIRGRNTKNDLQIDLHGAIPVQTLALCQPNVSFEVDSSGGVNVISGHACQSCQFAPKIKEVSP